MQFLVFKHRTLRCCRCRFYIKMLYMDRERYIVNVNSVVKINLKGLMAVSAAACPVPSAVVIM